MTSQVLKFVDFIKTQKSRYLQNKTLLLLQIKKFINYTSRATLWQKNTFVVIVTFKFVLFLDRLNSKFRANQNKRCVVGYPALAGEIQGIIQEKYGCIGFGTAKNNCSWGPGGSCKPPKGSRAMPW